MNTPQSLREQITFLVTCARKGDAVEPVVFAILSAVKASLPKKKQIPAWNHTKKLNADYGYNAAIAGMLEVVEK